MYSTLVPLIISATISCLKELGADILVDGSTVTVKGIKEAKKEVELNAIESGSTLRFLIPISSYLSKKVIFKGTEKLISRPLDIYQKLYNDNFVKKNNCIIINKLLDQNYYEIDGSISSQFISGLLFYLPLLKNDSEIKIINEYESKSYVDLTIDALNQITINARGYLISSEFIREINDNDIPFAEVPIKTIYTPETQAKGTNVKVAFQILLQMIRHQF